MPNGKHQWLEVGKLNRTNQRHGIPGHEMLRLALSQCDLLASLARPMIAYLRVIPDLNKIVTAGTSETLDQRRR